MLWNCHPAGMMMLVAIQNMLAQPCAALLQDSDTMKVSTSTELCAGILVTVPVTLSADGKCCILPNTAEHCCTGIGKNSAG